MSTRGRQGVFWKGDRKSTRGNVKVATRGSQMTSTRERQGLYRRKIAFLKVGDRMFTERRQRVSTGGRQDVY